ncbi:MAG: thioredoxin [Cyanobacteria bacterium J06659_2]
MTNAIKPITLTAENFEAEVIQSSVPVLVDFWAAWCGPCRIMNPVIEAIAAEFADTVKVGKVDADDQDLLALNHHVTAIPTLLFFQKGQVVERVSGVISQAAIAAKLNTLTAEVAV